MNKVPMTGSGFERLTEELKRIKTVDRPANMKALEVAREHGDIAENAEFHAAKEQQSLMERRIAELEDKLARAQIIDVSKLSGSDVKFGATVVVADEDTDEEMTFQIVGADEADVEGGLLSITSPMARALIGKTAGDSVEVNAPGGAKGYEVVSVKYG
jgi:transcription elongation factor GreA